MDKTFLHTPVTLSVLAVIALIFSITGLYNMGVDGHIYVAQINQIDAGGLETTPEDVALRAFKPLYPLVGATLTPLVKPETAVLILNVLFLFGLAYISRLVLLELAFEDRYATWGAVWIVTGYPVLKYGLAISTDIGGWFFFVSTIFLGLRAIRGNSLPLAVLTSTVGFLGATAKEPGVLGLFFVGIYLLLQFRTTAFPAWVKMMLCFALPALVLEVLLFVWLYLSGFPSFFDWYSLHTTESYVATHYTLFNMIGVLGTSFHLLWVYALFGASVYFFSRKKPLDSRWKIFVALSIAPLPVLAWTIPISRILYVLFIAVVPLALLGMQHLSSSDGVRRLNRRAITHILMSAPVIISVLLFILTKNKSLVSVLSELLR